MEVASIGAIAQYVSFHLSSASEQSLISVIYIRPIGVTALVQLYDAQTPLFYSKTFLSPHAASSDAHEVALTPVC
jgi:hypothetical protein